MTRLEVDLHTTARALAESATTSAVEYATPGGADEKTERSDSAVVDGKDDEGTIFTVTVTVRVERETDYDRRMRT